MAIRVTEDEVKQIIATNLSDPIILAHIGIASRIVDNHLEDQACHNVASLKDVELQLSAHFVALRERQLKGQKIDDAQDTYGGDFGKGLDFTQYGQAAKLIDCSGVLNDLGKDKLVMAFFGGGGRW